MKRLKFWLDASPDHRGPYFGHLRVPYEHFMQTWVWAKLASTVAPCDIPVILVTTRLEKEAISDLESLPGLNGTKTPKILTHAEFITFVEKNGVQRGTGSTDWRETDLSRGWMMHDTLPNQAIIIMTVEPHMPINCALALVALTIWASEISSHRADALIRVLTMSPEDQDPTLAQLLALHGVDAATPFEIGTAHDQTLPANVEVHCMGGNEIRTAVLAATRQDTDGNHAVLCFYPWYRVGDWPSGSWLKADMDLNVDLKGIIHVFTASTFPDIQGHIVCMTPSSAIPASIHGVAHVHLILGTTQLSSTVDHVTGQVTQVELPMSRAERLEQISWARRRTGYKHTTRIYLEAESIKQYIARGCPHRRLEVANGHAQGFITAICASSFLGGRVDKAAIIACFLRDMDVFNDFKTRLERHHVLASRPSLRTLGFSNVTQTAAFKAILPLLNYDPRLALFVSLPCSSPDVLQAKIELAAILTVGLGEVVSLNAPLGRMAEVRSKLIAACSGRIQPLVSQGTLWLILCLWKQAIVQTKDIEFEYTEDWEVVVGDGWATVSRVHCRDTIKLIKAVKYAMSNVGVKVSQYLLPIDFGRYSDDECLELQYGLMCAFAHQLTMARRGQGDRFTVRLVTTAANLKKSIAYVSKIPSSVDVVAITRHVGKLTFGIYTELYRQGSTVALLDWTWIPRQCVDKWMKNHTKETTLKALNSSQVSQQNIEEYWEGRNR